MRRAAAAGSLEIAQARIAAEQFVGLIRGENHLRHLLRLEAEAEAGQSGVGDAVSAGVDTFVRAFARQAGPTGP